MWPERTVLRTFCGLASRTLPARRPRRLQMQERVGSEPGRLTPARQGRFRTVRRRREEARHVGRAQRCELRAVQAGTLAKQPVMESFTGHVGDPTTGRVPLRERASHDHHGSRSWRRQPGCGGQYPIHLRGRACSTSVLAAGNPGGIGIFPRRAHRSVLVHADDAAPGPAVVDEDTGRHGGQVEDVPRLSDPTLTIVPEVVCRDPSGEEQHSGFHLGRGCACPARERTLLGQPRTASRALLER